MKFFIDTANLDEIKEVKAMGMCDGVTTNPSLMAKEGNTDTDAVLKEICNIVQGPVSGEVTALDAEGMIEEGLRLAAIDDHIVGSGSTRRWYFRPASPCWCPKPARPMCRRLSVVWTTSAKTACS